MVERTETDKHDRIRASCPVCNGDRQRNGRAVADHVTGRADVFLAVECSDCGVVYIADPPSPSTIGSYYETFAGAAMHTAPNRLFRALRDRRFLSDVRPLLDRLPADSAVADIGTGDGSLADFLHRRGTPSIGVDLYPAAQWRHPLIPYRQVNLAVKAPSAEDLAGVGRPVRGAVMRHVLEHVHRPVDLLTGLRDAGISHIAVVVPNIESGFVTRFGSDWYYWDPPRHLTFFSSDTLGRTGEQAGFRVAWQRTYGLDEVVTSLHRRSLLRRGPNRAATALRPTGMIAGAASVLAAPFGRSVLHAVLEAR